MPSEIELKPTNLHPGFPHFLGKGAGILGCSQVSWGNVHSSKQMGKRPQWGKMSGVPRPNKGPSKSWEAKFRLSGLGMVIWKDFTIWSNKALTPREEKFKFAERNVGILSWVSLRQLKKQEDLQRKRCNPSQREHGGSRDSALDTVLDTPKQTIGAGSFSHSVLSVFAMCVSRVYLRSTQSRASHLIESQGRCIWTR